MSKDFSEAQRLVKQFSRLVRTPLFKAAGDLEKALDKVASLDSIASDFEARITKAKNGIKRAESQLQVHQNALTEAEDVVSKKRKELHGLEDEAKVKARGIVERAKSEASRTTEQAKRQKDDIDALKEQVQNEVGGLKHELERANKELAETRQKHNAIKEQMRAAAQ